MTSDDVVTAEIAVPTKAIERRWIVRVQWEPRDIWVGVYWTRPEEFAGTPPRRRSRRWYVCIVPCFPIVINRLEKLR